jgi:hypothetical protein
MNERREQLRSIGWDDRLIDAFLNAPTFAPIVNDELSVELPQSVNSHSSLIVTIERPMATRGRL